MVKFRPFRAIRPKEEYVADVAALPYDVMTSDEARIMVGDKPLSFLHIDRAEIDLPPGTDPYSDAVYAKAKETLERQIREGVFVQDENPNYYIYRLTMNGRQQTGLVGCASIDDYKENAIKKHELTRADKEEDRVRHVDSLDANTGPIFLAARKDAGLSAILEKAVLKEPIYDFTAEDGVRHEVWVLDSAEEKDVLAVFEETGALYIADGHHRCASAARVGEKRRQQHPGYIGDEEFGFFLAVVFPEEQLEILDYNRVVADLNGMTKEEFLAKLDKVMDIKPSDKPGPAKPMHTHSFGMYLDGAWYLLEARPGTFDEKDYVKRLDVSVLQENVLSPILGIEDPRTDKRIDFVGGIRGLAELERRVNSDMKVAFAMYPTSMEELFDIADAGLIMPPKSTWFEPKLRSGLFIHKLSD